MGVSFSAYLTYQHSSLSSQIVKRKTGSNKQFNLKAKREYTMDTYPAERGSKVCESEVSTRLNSAL